MGSLVRRLLLLFWLLLTAALHPARVAADDQPGSPVTVGENKGWTSYQATITTNQQGVWVDVRARQFTTRSTSTGTSPPSGAPAGSAGNGGVTQLVSTGAGAGGGSPSNISRSWYDPARGYFSQTADGHVYNLQGANVGNASMGGWYSTGGRQHPNSVPMGFYVDGQFQGIVWVPANGNAGSLRWGAPSGVGPGGSQAGTGVGRSINVREIALEVLDHVPLPDVQIQTNPALGLVALPAWFWVEGYDGGPLGGSRTVSLPPEVGADVPTDEVPASDPSRRATSLTIQVRLRPTRYEWDFGDGTTRTSQSLGQKYPRESDIKHTYEHSSLGSPGGFPVRLTIEFAAEFQVNGGGAEQLPTIRRTYESRYRVQEIQAVLARPCSLDGEQSSCEQH
jgi:hypothetical protein